jgi:hypothetical protein
MITNETYTDIQILQNHDFEMVMTFDDLDILSTHEYAAVIALDKEHTEFQGPSWSGSAWSQGAVNVVPLTIVADQSADTVTISLPGIATRFFTDTFEGVWDLVQKDTSGAADVYTRQVQGDVVVSAGATRLSDTFTASVA